MCISVNKLDDEIDIFHDSITALNRVSHRQQLLLVITSLSIIILCLIFLPLFSICFVRHVLFVLNVPKYVFSMFSVNKYLRYLNIYA